MRDIQFIVIHCTATPQSATGEAIKKYWRETLKWKNPGYHYIIDKDGRETQLLDEGLIANGVKGYNHSSIHVSYIGGIDKNGKPIDNRTGPQRAKMLNRLYLLKQKYPNARIQGHRDFLKPGTPQWKDCPSFDVREWLKEKGANKLL